MNVGELTNVTITCQLVKKVYQTSYTMVGFGLECYFDNNK